MDIQLLIKNGMILQPNGVFLKGCVGVADGKIAAVWYGAEPPLCANAETMDAENFMVSPGFIDTHNHGGCGFDFAYEKPGWEKLEERLAKAGVTSILATICSRSPEETLKFAERAIRMAEKNESRKVDIIGIHMEGPYINKNRKGIHVEEYIRPGDAAEAERILERAGGFIKVWTLAPDSKENMDLIPVLARAGVSVSIAHTEAGYPAALAAFTAGANRVTHTFNTMPPLSHRYEGIVTAAWQHGAYMELIADCLHVSPTIVKMFVAASDPEKIVLVSDNNELAGLPDGSYIQDGRRITIARGRMETESGVLAGSVASLNQCALNISRCGFSAGAAIKMASENPARSAGVFDRKGSVAPGKDADIAILDGRFEPAATIKGGKIVYRGSRFPKIS